MNKKIASNKNFKRIIIFLIIPFVALSIVFACINKEKILYLIEENNYKAEEAYDIDWKIKEYNQETQTAVVLIKFYSEDGIEKIEYPNNRNTLYCNDKKIVGIDYKVTTNEQNKFIMYTNGNSIEKNIYVIDDMPQTPLITIDTSDPDRTNITITYSEEEDLLKYYSLDNGETWDEYAGSFFIDDMEFTSIEAKSKRKYGVKDSEIAKVFNEREVCLLGKRPRRDITGDWQVWWRQVRRGITINSNNIQTMKTGDGPDYGYFGTNYAIRVDNYNKIVIIGDFSGGVYYISDRKYNYDTYWTIAQFPSYVRKTATRVDDNKYVIDISDIEGNYWIGASFGVADYATITGVYLEK